MNVSADRKCAVALCWLVSACRPAQSSDKSPQQATSVVARQTTTEACATEIVTNGTIRGAIFPETCAHAISPRHLPEEAVVGYFRPTPALIQTLESRLLPALELARNQPETVVRMTPADDRAEVSWYVSGALGLILEHWSKYRRQYAGIILRGDVRRVLVNSFPEVGFPDGTDDHPNWVERWMDDVDDGAELYWRVQYDIASAKFLGFETNSSA